MSQSVSNAAWYTAFVRTSIHFFSNLLILSMPFAIIMMIAGALNCVNWRRLGELPQECGALIMGFLDGKDLWAFVSSSKRWRKISDEVPSLGSSYAHGRMAH